MLKVTERGLCTSNTCSYCGLPMGEDKVSYEGKPYHEKCAGAINVRRNNPSLFKVLDRVRQKMESLYDDPVKAASNQNSIYTVNRILSKI